MFATLLSSIPAGLQGPDEDPDTVIPVDPSLLTGFSETANYTPASYGGGGPIYYYDYSLGEEWRATTDNDTAILLGAKVFFYWFWFGGLEPCEFKAPDGTDRGTQLSFDEIDLDAEEGSIRYSLTLSDRGDSAGALVIYWNNTEYTSVDDAWDSGEVYLLHGIGFSSSATANIGELLVSLLFLQLPDVPVLINVFIAVPIWACIVYVIWFIVKEMIPFL